jgi:hypothetical protein
MFINPIAERTIEAVGDRPESGNVQLLICRCDHNVRHHRPRNPQERVHNKLIKDQTYRCMKIGNTPCCDEAMPTTSGLWVCCQVCWTQDYYRNKAKKGKPIRVSWRA